MHCVSSSRRELNTTCFCIAWLIGGGRGSYKMLQLQTTGIGVRFTGMTCVSLHKAQQSRSVTAVVTASISIVAYGSVIST